MKGKNKMIINFKIYKAKKGNADASYLPASQKTLIYDINIEGSNGNEIYKKLYEQIDIKTRWQIKKTRIA